MAIPYLLDVFGHQSMRQNGHPAMGSRPLLVVLVEWDENPPLSDYHPLDYYERLAFGDPRPPFTTRDPLNPASLTRFFLENSSGRFEFSRYGVHGPLRMGPLGADPGPEARYARILATLAQQKPTMFFPLDANENLRLDTDELCVLVCENFPDAYPANRDNLPIAFPVYSGPVSLTYSARLHFAGIGPRTPFYQIAHELSHSLGTLDLYNVGSGNQGLTLMSRYDFYSDDQHAVHLDAWHKIQLGWAEPSIVSLTSPGSADVAEGANGSVIVCDEVRGSSEYFILERRTPTGARAYDDAVAGDGVCVWRVRQGGAPAHLGAPDLELGGSGVWTAGTRTPPLVWEDGSSSGVALSVDPASGGALRVSW